MAILVQFPYDPVKINKIKSIPSARFDAARRGWLIPNAYKDHAERLLAAQAVAIPPRPAAWHVKADPPIKPWQQEALDYAWGKPAVLLDMGMGTMKTRIAIDLIHNSGYRTVCVICPLSVIPVWEQQLAQYGTAPSLCTRLDTGSSARNVALAHAGATRARETGVLWVCVVNYEACWRAKLGEWMLAQTWDCMITDECHRHKAPGGVAARFLYRLGFQATQRLGLSGTPLAHSPLDAYGVFRVLDPTIFGTNYRKFQDTYCVMGGFQSYQVLAYKNQAEFQEKFTSIRFHVSRDVLDLETPLHIDIPIRLPHAAQTVYDALQRDFYAEVSSGTITIANALVRLLRLQEATSGYVHLDDDSRSVLHTAKADALSDLLTDLDPREPVVVFARFRRDLQVICERATTANRQYYELSGTHKALARWQQACDAPASEGHGAVLGVQIGAGSEGIDLTKARYCVFYSLPLSLAQYDQALARVHRPGQTRSVTYYQLTATGTVDGTIQRALTQRREVIDAIVNGTEELCASRMQRGAE